MRCVRHHKRNACEQHQLRAVSECAGGWLPGAAILEFVQRDARFRFLGRLRAMATTNANDEISDNHAEPHACNSSSIESLLLGLGELSRITA